MTAPRFTNVLAVHYCVGVVQIDARILYWGAGAYRVSEIPQDFTGAHIQPWTNAWYERMADHADAQRAISAAMWREPSPTVLPNIDCDMSGLVTGYHDYPDMDTLLEIEAHEALVLN